MTLQEIRELWQYAMREAYMEGWRDSTRFEMRVNDFMQIDERFKQLELWFDE